MLWRTSRPNQWQAHLIDNKRLFTDSYGVEEDAVVMRMRGWLNQGCILQHHIVGEQIHISHHERAITLHTPETQRKHVGNDVPRRQLSENPVCNSDHGNCDDENKIYSIDNMNDNTDNLWIMTTTTTAKQHVDLMLTRGIITIIKTTITVAMKLLAITIVPLANCS